MEQDESAVPTDPTQGQGADAANLDKIRHLLRAKDDTQRFVGLALLKTVLDNSTELRQDEETIQSLWASISSKFLDRLLKTGSKPSNKDAKDMLDLAVSVLHTFAVLLPQSSREEAKFIGRIPLLVAAALHSSPETTELHLQLLITLVNSRPGAEAFVQVDDLSALTEMAPSNARALDVFEIAWLNAMEGTVSKKSLSDEISGVLRMLIPSFSRTDAVTLLDFLGSFLQRANREIIPAQPPWLKGVVSHIQNLVTSRPTPEARAAYTNAAASLLQTYPDEVSKLLFTEDKSEEKPFGYLFVNLLLIDIRSSAPMLLEQLNSPDYPSTSRRLASAFDVISMFIGFLLRSLDDDGPMVMQPDSLLKLRKGVSDTMSVTVEFLRDRWDASVAGAMGLHPDARSGAAETSTGSHRTLPWDSLKNNADEDPFTLSALQAVSLWLREEENETLRKEATGLTDMLMDLYRSSSADGLDFRSTVLVALEALITTEDGRDMLLKQDGWKILTQDLAAILQRVPSSIPDNEASRGIETIRVLLPITEEERSGTAEEWMNLITTVAAWDVPEGAPSPLVLEFEIAVLQLCSVVLIGAAPGMRKRYTHSIGAIAGIASRLQESVSTSDPLREQMEDVLGALASVR